MPVLSAKQQEDINYAIYEYLVKFKFDTAASAFQTEVGVEFNNHLKTSNTPESLKTDILERKWTSIARLSKKNKDLERQC